MGRLVLHWVCVCALVALPVGGCSDETTAAGGTGGMGGEGGSGDECSGSGSSEVVVGSEFAEPRTLIRFFVKDATARNAVCNDGTDAVFYFAAGSGAGEGKWIINLETGGDCGTPEACVARAESRPDKVSSASYPETTTRGGIFAPDPVLNPDFFNWNAVQIKYCSSAWWHGSKAATEEPGGFHFRGHDIIHAVLEDLQDAAEFGPNNLANATAVIFSGQSAGAVGVKHNLDRVAETLSWADVRGLDDSAFFSREAMGLNPAEAGNYTNRIAYQGLVLDDSCAADELEPDICAEMMTVALRHVTTPYFVVIDQGDLIVRIAIPDPTPERYDIVAASTRQLVTDHGAGFAPWNNQHVWIGFPSAYQYRVDGSSMLETFGRWYFGREGCWAVVQRP